MQNTKEKYTRYVIAFIFIFLGFIGMSVYPTSHSKFIDSNDNALVYETKLYRLFNGILDVHFNTASTYKNLQLSFDLPRNNIALSNETDLYTIEIPNTCRVTTSGLTILTSTDSTNRYQTSFSGAAVSKTINVSCSVAVDTSGTKALNIPVMVYEQIENEQAFLYKRGAYLVDNYYDIKPLPSVTSSLKDFVMPVDAKNKYQEFVIWLEQYLDETVSVNTDKTLVKNYVKTVYNSDATLMNQNLSLAGITMTYDAAKKEYAYHIEDNLLGYAKTQRAPSPRYMYFTTTDKAELNKAFAYYLKKYLTNDNDYNLVQEYIDHYSNGLGISYLILVNSDGTYNKISGFDYYYDDDNEFVLDERLLEYAYSYKNKKIQISHRSVSLMKTSFKVSFRNLYRDLISEDVYNQIISDDSEILTAISIKNQASFHNFYMVYDGLKKQYLYIEVYRRDGESYNYVEIHMIPEIDNMTISLVDVTGEIKVLVNNTTVADLNAFVDQLTIRDEVIVVVPNVAETAINIQGATAEEIVDIITQLNTYIETLKTNNAIVSKEEEEPILNSEEEVGIKE